MTINERCVPSTEFEWKRVKKVKLPPGGGRAAAGGTTIAEEGASPTERRQPKGTQWLAVTYLGGAQCRYRLQIGKHVVWLDGGMTLHDALSAVRDARPKGKRD